jgi:hypothetical protein
MEEKAINLRIKEDTCCTFHCKVHCKKRCAVFPSAAGMSLTKISLYGSNIIIPNQGQFGNGPPGWGRENR